MKKKTAIIIGASSDIGRKIIKKLKEKKWCVYGSYNIHKKRLKDVLDEDYMFKIDLNREDSKGKIEEVIKKVWKKEKQINAGIYIAGVWYLFYKFTEENEDKVREMWNINYFGAYQFFKTLTPYAIQTKDVSLVAIGSTVGLKGSPHAETYGATKAALTNLIISLSEELANHGIRANIISPGPVDTKAFRKYFPTKTDLREIVKNVPLNRLAETEDIADSILYLLRNKYVTRQNIILDGASIF